MKLHILNCCRSIIDTKVHCKQLCMHWLIIYYTKCMMHLHCLLNETLIELRYPLNWILMNVLP